MNTQSPKFSANPITVTPIWKQDFVDGEHPIRGLYWVVFEKYFCLHIKDSEWGIKCIFMNCASRNVTNPITATTISK